LNRSQEVTPNITPETSLVPTREELEVLTGFERFAYRFVRRMNRGAWKRFWTWCQSTMGAGWIHLSTYNIMNIYGLEHVEAASRERPLLLVANHRSFFDMYAVSAMLFRHTKWRKQLYFPVRGRFFYQHPLGMIVNLIMGWFSMYPPFFATGDHPIPEKRTFDKFSFRLLTELARTGPGNVIGFHPEGKRNKNDDPYSFLRGQPGVGKLIMDAKPQVIPVFIAGLCNDLRRQVARNWNREEVIRLHFGPVIDLTDYLSRPDRLRTHKEIADALMEKITELAEQDKKMYGAKMYDSASRNN
jgi:1-acyl-sn-glycerol-3-phosphate acyltransferase